MFAIEPESWRALPVGMLELRQDSRGAEHRVDLRRDRLCRIGRRAEPVSEQLDSRQRVRHGAVRAEARQPGHRHGRRRRRPCTSYIFEPTPANMARWRSWWRFANVEQVFSFVLVTIITIAFTSMLAHSTLFGEPNLPNNVSFLRIEAQRMEAMVGRWFGVLFLAIGAFSLFGSAMGIIDYTSRLAADILKTTYLPKSPMTESRMYFWLVWGMVGLGCSILLVGHVAADHAARHLGVDGRHDHVPVLVAADRAEQEDAAGGHSHQPVPHGDARVVDAAVRIARDVHDLRSECSDSYRVMRFERRSNPSPTTNLEQEPEPEQS